MTTHTDPVLEIRRGSERGETDLNWLHSRHSFSFGAYRNPQRMGFRSLRVLNDDIVGPGGGFGQHGHDNMEIISWVLDGALAHADSTGTRGVIRPGDVQVMSAGSGILHSETNASPAQPVHFLQIWITPAQRNVPPTYAQEHFDAAGRRNQWQLVVSPDAQQRAVRINQDARLSIADLEAGQRIEAALDAGRHGYLHIATGSVRLGTQDLHAGDAVTLAGPAEIEVTATAPSQLLWFDLA